MSNISNWLVDGFHVVEETIRYENGHVRVSHGTIMEFDVELDEFTINAVQYDGAPDQWGKFKSYEEQEVPSGHDWVERNEMYESSWNIGDGWTEAHSIGLPGVYMSDPELRVLEMNNVVCDSCRVYTNKYEEDCSWCGSSIRVDA
jgi:hypothetical protein